MSWDCCNPKGECQGGLGCPAGARAQTKEAAQPADQRESCGPGVCESLLSCRDLACPAHPCLSWHTKGLQRAKVARVKSRMPKHPQNQPPSWRRYLPDFASAMLKTLLVGFLILLGFTLLTGLTVATN